MPKKGQKKNVSIPPDVATVMPFGVGPDGPAWLAAASPILIADRLERISSWQLTGNWIANPSVHNQRPTRQMVSTYASRTGAKWIVTGWVSGQTSMLTVSLQLWKVVKGSSQNIHPWQRGDTAVLYSESVAQAPRKNIVVALAQTTTELRNKAQKIAAESESLMVLPVETKDDYALLLFGRGVQQAHNQDFSAAQKQLKRAMTIDSQFAAAHRVYADVLLHQKKASLAERSFAAALLLRPDYKRALLGRVAALQALGNHSDAHRIFVAIVRQRPWDVDAKLHLAKSFWQRGDVVLARQNLQSVIEQEPNNVAAWRQLSVVEAGTLNRDSNNQGGDAMLLALQRIAQIDPSDPKVLLDIAATYREKGERQKAIDTYQRALPLLDTAHSPKLRLFVLHFLSELYEATDQQAKAIQALQVALTDAPTDPKSYFSLARLLTRSGEADKAVEIYKQALLRFPKYHLPCLSNLALLMRRQGNTQQEETYLRQILVIAPDNNDARGRLAAVLLKKGRPEPATWHAKRVLRKVPGHVGSSQIVAEGLRQQGRLYEAYNILKTVAAAGVKQQTDQTRHLCRVLREQSLARGSFVSRWIIHRFDPQNSDLAGHAKRKRSPDFPGLVRRCVF